MVLTPARSSVGVPGGARKPLGYALIFSISYRRYSIRLVRNWQRTFFTLCANQTYRLVLPLVLSNVGEARQGNLDLLYLGILFIFQPQRGIGDPTFSLIGKLLNAIVQCAVPSRPR